ncbi:MAG: phosphoenolpyruvate--protein phosphotransferase [Silvanigrellaceae bacterium]
MKASSRKTLLGVPICNGLVVAKLSKGGTPAPSRSSSMTTLTPDQEWAQFLNAQCGALDQINEVLSEATDESQQNILNSVMEGYELLLTDEIIIEHIKQLVYDEHLDSASAIEKVFSDAASKIAASVDEYLREKSTDIVACKEFLVTAMTSRDPQEKFAHLKDRIVVVELPTPQDIILFHQARVAGIITEQGAELSHAAILARSLNIPTLFGVKGILDHGVEGQIAILDTAEAIVVINPSRAEVRKTEARRAVDLMVNQKLKAKAGSSARTLDGEKISVLANADGPVDSNGVLTSGAEGIGLLRTEFLHLNSASMPSVEESTVFFRMTAASLAPQPITIRLLDAGGDKPYPNGHSYPPGPYGLRGIRFLLDEKTVLEAQLQALIKANSKANIRILVPFVTDVEEIRSVKRKVQQIWSDLPADERAELQIPQIGAMVETPSAVMLLDHLCSECDFLSIGSNDLTQHVLCLERSDPHAAVQSSSFHPAVLRSLKIIFDQQKNSEIAISLCGELASDPIATELLIGLGCRNLSARGSSIPLLKDIIRNIHIGDAEKLSQIVLRMNGAEEVRQFLGERYRSKFDYETVAGRRHNQAG